MFTNLNFINILQANYSIKTKIPYMNTVAYFTRLTTVSQDPCIYRVTGIFCMRLGIFAVYILNGIKLYSAFPISAIN